ncbi:MAG TPA: ABC transporter permease [Blastocatellia bacterium]|jgi:simple sugar transport system permease protein|nr:ABC transporter permease [Blastocatellia bacterium]
MKSLLTELMFPLVAVVAAFLVGGIIVWMVGDSPLLVYELFFTSAFGSIDGIGYTLFYATPLILTGLAVAVAFKCGLLNIGAEGQLVAAAFATAWVGLVLPGWPAPVVVFLAAFAAVAVGGMWAGVPGVLKARFGAHEVITTIMMNFIAIALVSYLTQYHYRRQGDPILETLPIAEMKDGVLVGPHIPRMHTLLAPLGINFPERLPLNLAFLLALGACVLVYVFLWKTKWGYELRAVGINPSAAEYGGISISRNVVMAMFISGMLAGMVGINDVLGYRYRYYDGFSAGYGFTGIAVALLGRNHPVGVLLAAILFGALIRSGLFIDIFTDNVSKDWVVILQAIIILFVACEAIFRGGAKRLIRGRV